MRRSGWWAFITLLALGSGAAFAQASAAGANSKAAAPAASDAAQAAPEGSVNTIDQILEGEEDILQGTGYTYDPGSRRDPFKSLLITQDKTKTTGPRPPDIPGLLIDEIDVTGIFHTSKGWVAQVQAGNREKSYLVKEGDQLFDGDVVSISKSEVVFKQIVNDPTALKPFREVVKKLNP
ncbi:MAG: hypothetical protein ABI609_03355 [Acidobacteriota bacterium]